MNTLHELSARMLLDLQARLGVEFSKKIIQARSDLHNFCTELKQPERKKWWFAFALLSNSLWVPVLTGPQSFSEEEFCSFQEHTGQWNTRHEFIERVAYLHFVLQAAKINHTVTSLLANPSCRQVLANQQASNFIKNTDALLDCCDALGVPHPADTHRRKRELFIGHAPIASVVTRAQKRRLAEPPPALGSAFFTQQLAAEPAYIELNIGNQNEAASQQVSLLPPVEVRS